MAAASRQEKARQRLREVCGCMVGVRSVMSVDRRWCAAGAGQVRGESEHGRLRGVTTAIGYCTDTVRSEDSVKSCGGGVLVRKVKIDCLVVEWARVLSGPLPGSATPRACSMPAVKIDCVFLSTGK